MQSQTATCYGRHNSSTPNTSAMLGRKVIYSSSEKSRLFIADEIISVSNPLVARKQ